MFFKKKNHYSETVKILTEQGCSDEYISALEAAMLTAKSAADKAEGQSHYANAMLFKGELDKAYSAFAETDIHAVPDLIRQAFAANYLLCLFLMNKFREAGEIYTAYNKDLLSNSGAMMRRSLGIHEFISGNYDAAVTVFLKLADDTADPDGTVMADICLTRALLKLDMYSQAADICAVLDRYNGRKQLETLCKKLKKQVFDGVSSSDKVKMIKNKRKK